MAKNSISEIAAALARKQKIGKKEATDIVMAFFNTIADGLRDDRLVKVRGLGTFKVTAVKARESVNVNTGERVVIEGHDKVSFVPDQSMKDLVNKPFAQFTTVVVNDGVNFDSIDAASAAEERKVTAQQENAQEQDEEPETTDDELEDDEKQDEQEEQQQEQQEQQQEEQPQETIEATINDEPDVPTGNVIGKVTEEPKEEATDEPKEEVIDSTADFDKEPEPSAPVAINKVLYTNSSKEDEKPSEEIKANNTSTVAKEEVTDKANNSEEEENDEANVSREYFDEQMASCRRRCNRNLVLSLVLLIVGLVGGFFIGKYVNLPNISSQQPAKDTTAVAKAVQPAVEKPVAEPAVNDSTPAIDTTKVAEKTEEKAEEKVEKKDKKPTEAEQDDMTPDMKKLNSDRRLRFGAYEIVGVDKVIKLKKGQTMQSYSNKTLGKDMVVYFQVLNGVDDVKPGESLKVPKIRLKKKFRKPTP